MALFGNDNPYLGLLPPQLGEDGDVSLAAPVILLLGLVAIGAALLFFKSRNTGYDDYDGHDSKAAKAAVSRLRNVITDIESD